MIEKKFKKQKEIMESAVKNKAFNVDFSDGYINALYDYNLITDNQFNELYFLIWEGKLDE